MGDEKRNLHMPHAGTEMHYCLWYKKENAEKENAEGSTEKKMKTHSKKRGKINAGGICGEAAQFLLWKWSAYNQAALLAVSSFREFWLSNCT